MNALDSLMESETQAAAILRATVVAMNSDGSVRCAAEDEGGQVVCDLLHTADGPRLRLKRGDRVLLWLPEADAERGVLLGRIGPSRPSTPKDDTPDELIIEAKQNLTLKCGDGSITIRADGKVLIKGKDLVSHAKRTNRIKGGSVAIN